MDSGNEFHPCSQRIGHSPHLFLSSDLITDDVFRRKGPGSLGHCDVLGISKQMVQC